MYVFRCIVRAFRDRETEGVFDDFELKAAMGSVEHYSVTFPWLFLKKGQKRRRLVTGKGRDKRW